jgi:hypothetical protein
MVKQSGIVRVVVHQEGIFVSEVVLGAVIILQKIATVS